MFHQVPCGNLGLISTGLILCKEENEQVPGEQSDE